MARFLFVMIVTLGVNGLFILGLEYLLTPSSEVTKQRALRVVLVPPAPPRAEAPAPEPAKAPVPEEPSEPRAAEPVSLPRPPEPPPPAKEQPVVAKKNVGDHKPEPQPKPKLPSKASKNNVVRKPPPPPVAPSAKPAQAAAATSSMLTGPASKNERKVIEARSAPATERKVEKAEPAKPFVPVLLRRVEPVYPRFARRRGVEGYVLVEFGLDAQGVVQDPRVLNAEPGGAFEQSALRALREWRFAPPPAAATQRVRQRIEFKLR